MGRQEIINYLKNGLLEIIESIEGKKKEWKKIIEFKELMGHQKIVMFASWQLQKEKKGAENLFMEIMAKTSQI